jgi:hypothetical protein
MSTIRELSRLSQIPLDCLEVQPGERWVARADPRLEWATFSDYVKLGGERIWIKVYRGEIVKAEAPPDFGRPHINRKWIAGSGPVGLEAAQMLRATADL